MNEIFSRTSIRRYLDKPVEKEKIDQLLHAAMAAPSAGNQQCWQFIVVDDKQLLKELSSVSPYARPCANAPIVIVVCKSTDNLVFEDYFQQDLSAATENILLEAVSCGLGAVWMGIAPLQDRIDKVAAVLNTPENIIPFALISVGYPAEEKKQQDRFDVSRIHYNKF